ncbi:MAG: DUF6078 family protein [Prevotellaceae bacterium]|jgi:hypothetical protein|nr:DUF6078 family protein [Prevotellaceae bacterium]
MNEEFDYTIVPKNFVYCLNGQCERAAECMSYRLAAHQLEQSQTITILNPRLTAANCHSFYPSEQVTFATGIAHLFDRLPYETAQSLKQRFLQTFGRNNYYRWMRQESLITPDQQEEIRRLLRSAGSNDEPVYERYVRQYSWQTTNLKKTR